MIGNMKKLEDDDWRWFDKQGGVSFPDLTHGENVVILVDTINKLINKNNKLVEINKTLAKYIYEQNKNN